MSDEVVGDGFDAAFDKVFDDALSSGTTDETPDSTDAEPEATTSESEGEAETESSRVRDEQGRFVKADEQVETESSESAESSDEEPGAEETPAEPPDATTEPEKPAVDTQKQWDELPAVTYRASGEALTIPGSKLGPDGAFIPKDALADVTRTLASGRESFRRAQEWTQKETGLTTRAEAAEATRDHVLKQLDEMVANGTLADWLLDVERNYPILKANAETAGLKRQYAEAENVLQQQRTTEERARMRPIMDQALADTILEYGNQAGLDKQDLEPLYHRLRDPEMESVLFPVADRDMPEIGVTKGQRVINRMAVQQEVSLLGGVVKRYKPAPPSPALKQAAAKNEQTQAAVTKQKETTPPPTVAAKRGTVSKGKAGKTPAFANSAEADEYWFGKGLDEHFEE